MDEWIVNVDYTLEHEPEILKKEIIYPVPLCLKNAKTMLFYHPKEISFGPQHFRAHGRLEIFKSEVAREFHGRLKDSGLESLVENLKDLLDEKRENKLKKSYSKEVVDRFPEDKRLEVFSWMLARDGCFVLEVLNSFSPEDRSEAKSSSSENRPKAPEKTVLQHILKRDNHHPLLNDIVKDMFKLENQLPLWVLEEIRKGLERPKGDWFESALKNLSPIEVREEDGSRTYNNRIHILQLLGEYMIDNDTSSTTLQGKETQRDEADNRALLTSSTTQHGEGNRKIQFEQVVIIWFLLLGIILLSPVLIIRFLWLLISFAWESYQDWMWGRVEEDERHVPTIEELHRIGVKFKKLKRKGISHIKFDESKSTLYLPKFTVDDRAEVILRNLLVMETQWEDAEKIMTRYVVFMNDLVNTSGDVSLMRQQGIIANKLGSDDDVARLWNSVTIPATDIPSYDPIDTASTSINAYRRKGLRILWAQFRRVHWSKPWLAASFLGGICLLSLTIVQVVCLFQACEKR